jgi:SAM-dependent methyltransferase
VRRREESLAGRIAALLPSGRTRVLEVGCGEGSNMSFLKSHMPRAVFTGVDFSPEKLDFMREAGVDAQAVCADARSLPFARDIFDAVLLRDILHHVDWARDEVMTEALRSVRKGGTILVLESNGNKFLNRIFRIVYPVEHGMKHSTPNKLKSLMRRHGDVEMHFMEASILVRALGFCLGWPANALRFVFGPAYAVAEMWEKACRKTTPKQSWTYMMFTLRKE